MNKCTLTGRITRDADIKTTTGNNPTTVARVTLAIDRKYKKGETDFISCVAFGKIAEWMEKYTHKGMKLEIVGHIQTGSYEKDGKKVYTTDVIVEEADFAESKKASGGSSKEDDDGFINVPDGVDEELPFA